MYPFPTGSDWERGGNPHLHFLVEAIRARGYICRGVTFDQLFEPRRLRESGIDILHVHWPGEMSDFISNHKILPNPSNRWLARKTNKLVKLLLDLLSVSGFACLVKAILTHRVDSWGRRLREVGIPLVWQIHDIRSHHLTGQSMASLVDDRVHAVLFGLASGVIVHERSCLPFVEDSLGIPRLSAVCRLGSYRSTYGEKISKAEARRRLGVAPHNKVVAYIGSARANRNPRGVDQVMAGMQRDDVTLIVAGAGVGEYIGQARSARVVLDGYVQSSQLRDVICAADFVVNDGARYLTSAVIRSALSYGVPVIAYRYGAAIDMADGATVWIDEGSGGLEAAIANALSTTEEEWARLSRAAVARDAERNWDGAGVGCDGLYRTILEA